MNANHDNPLYGEFLSPLPFPEEEGKERQSILKDSQSAVWSTGGFARRVQACETPLSLDMLHTLMLRRVPVRQRADFIALLNQREEELSFLYSGTAYAGAE
ncbi:hypothetical protein [Enterobacter roggenkampii]|uniref:hypothetical protein n=1 Tax=Enterobacter roggenkampii TaxID=1812935 RepID=UPI0032AFFAC2